MTWLEVVVNILAGSHYVPRTKPEPKSDPAEGRGWILGAAILIGVFLYVVFQAFRNPGI